MARLQGTDLYNAQLQGADLYATNLQKADLCEAGLQGVDLDRAHLQGADLRKAHLQGAFLGGAHLQGVFLDETHLEGVISTNWSPSTFFEDRIRNQIGTKTDLSGAIFADASSQRDADSIEQFLKDSGAIIKAYTKEEAEQWIAEYKKAMSEVPEDDS